MGNYGTIGTKEEYLQISELISCNGCLICHLRFCNPNCISVCLFHKNLTEQRQYPKE